MTLTFPGVQLAREFDGWPDGENAVYVEPKLDGYRMAVCLKDGKALVRCRKDEKVSWEHNVQHIVKQLQDFKLWDGCMIDGELTGKSWGKLSELVRLKSPTEEQRERILRQVNFTIFDVVKLRDKYPTAVVGSRGRKQVPYYALNYTHRMKDRSACLLGARSLGSNLFLVDTQTATSEQEVWDIHARHIQAGYEGSIVKLNRDYFFDRTPYWLKIKPTKTIDVTITGYEEGKGKYVGMLGAFICQSESGDKIRVGGGFVDEQRSNYWFRRKSLKGKVIEIRCQDDDVATARHPVFIRFRNDTNKEYVK